MQIPRYDQPRVNQAPLPGIRQGVQAPLEAFGGGASTAAVNQGIDANIDQQTRSRAKGFQEANEIAAMEAESRAMLLRANLENSVQEMQGKDAFGAHEYASKEWMKGIQDIEKTLTNDVQRQAFARSALHNATVLNARVDSHIRQQRQVWDDNEFKGLLKNYNDDLARDPSDVNANLTFPDIMDKFQQYARRKGLTPEDAAYKAMETAVLSDAHAAVLTSRLNAGDDKAAAAYFKANKGEMDAEHIERFGKAVEAGSTYGNARRKADVFLAKYEDEAQAFEAAAKIEDAKERSLTEQFLEHDFARKRNIEEHKYQGVFDEVEGILSSNGGDMKDPRLATLMPQLKLKHQQAFKKMLNGPVVTVQSVKYDLLKRAAKPETRKEFMNLDLLDYKGSLSTSDFDEVAKLQMGLIKDDAAAKEKADGFLQVNTLVGNLMDERPNLRIGQYDTPETKAEVEGRRNEILGFADSYYRRVKEANNGKAPSNEEVTKHVKDLMGFSTVQKPGTLYGTNDEEVANLQEYKAMRERVGKIDPNERRLIERILIEAGVPAFDRNILDLFDRRATEQRDYEGTAGDQMRKFFRKRANEGSSK